MSCRSLAAALACAALPALSLAADMPDPTPAADPLAQARGLIQSQQWQAALVDLRRVNATASADWNNLMGFASRKQPRPDLDASQRYYDAALRIDPRHAGALAYSGELALMKGDLATAEARAASLAQVCRAPCAAVDELGKSIASYKAGTWKPY